MSQQTTTPTVEVTDFRNAFLSIWREIFEPVEGRHDILDSGTSLFETLADISVEEANIPVSSQSASLAAQVQHTAFYIEAIRNGLASNWTAPADWDASWQVDPVDEAAWQQLVGRLRAAYEWVDEFADRTTAWDQIFIGVAFSLVAHAAYHLGEIRQGIGVIRGR